MATINYDPQAQIKVLIQKLANAELENTRQAAIIEAAGKQIDDLEAENKKLKDEQVKNVKADKPKESAK